MAPASSGSDIVAEWCGQGTGDRVYRTADGNMWATDRQPARYVTGETKAIVVAGRVVTSEESER
jgi:hypothetical protein